MYWKPSSTHIAVPTQVLRNGVRFPLHHFITDFFNFVGIGLAQLVPNSFIHLICFIAACHELHIKPALDFFFNIFTLTKTKEQGFRALNRLPNHRAWMQPPSSNKGWHSNWFFVSGPDTHLIQSWGDAVRPVIDPLGDKRKKSFQKFCQKIPTEPWDLALLSNPQWLHDHGLVIYKPQPNPQTLSLLPRPPSPPIIPTEPILTEPSSAELLINLPEPSPQTTKSALDLTDSEKHELRKRKRRKLSSPDAISIPPISTLAAPLPSPPRSPSPLLPTKDTSPELPKPPLHPILVDSDPSPDPKLTISPPSPHSSPSTADPGPSSSTNPFPFIPSEDFPYLSFFPSDAISSFPRGLFQLFNLPSDNSHFLPTDPNSLLTTTALHLGQALGGFSRLLTLQSGFKDQSVTIAKLQSDLDLLQKTHSDLHYDHSSLQTQLQINIDHSNTLETYLTDQTLQNDQLQTQLTNLTTEHTLHQQKTDQIITDLQKTVLDLQEQIKQKDDVLHFSAVANNQLEEENLQLKIQHQNITEDSRRDIIEEYKRSQELTDAIVEQYDKGYSFAKGKIKNAGLNPKDMGFSSDEEDAAP